MPKTLKLSKRRRELLREYFMNALALALIKEGEVVTVSGHAAAKLGRLQPVGG